MRLLLITENDLFELRYWGSLEHLKMLVENVYMNPQFKYDCTFVVFQY